MLLIRNTLEKRVLHKKSPACFAGLGLLVTLFTLLKRHKIN